MKYIKPYSLPIVFLWGSSMGYIFGKTYYCNQEKLKIIEANKDGDKLVGLNEGPNYNPFKPYRNSDINGTRTDAPRDC